MLDIINRYAHGYVTIPPILACRERGLFNYLEEHGPADAKEIADKFNANRGHLQVVLRILYSMKWRENPAA